MTETRSFEALAALWTRTFGQPPAIKASTAEIAMLLVRHLPRLGPYRPGHPDAPVDEQEIMVSDDPQD